MKPFLVIGLGRFLKENSVESVFAAFSDFFHSISYKYQKKSKLVIIDKDYHQNLNRELAARYKIEEATLFLGLDKQAEIEITYKEGSVLLLPRKTNSSSIIKEALQYALPVIGYSHSSHDNLLDASSGLRVYYESDIQAVEALAENLRLLKYDPEALKMLKKGASNKFEKEFNWGERRQEGA